MSKPAITAGLVPFVLSGLKDVLLSGLAGLALAGIGWSGEAPQPLSSATIARYVADLNSDSRAIRAAAESALLTAGPAVLDELPLTGSLPDPTSRESLERIIRSIESSQFQAALNPRTVKLSGVHHLAEAVLRISQETGNSLVVPDSSIANTPLTFPATPVTFWEAISSIEQQLSLHYHAGMWEPVMANAPRLPSSLSGPFRIELVHCEHRTTTRGAQLLNAKVRLACEPRLRPLFLIAAVDDWSITSGPAAASPFTPMARREIPATSTGEIDVAFDFVVPMSVNPQAGWTIAGDVKLTMSGLSTAVTFSDLAAKLPLTRRRGQSSLSLLKVTTSESHSSVRIATAFPHLQGLFESYRASLLSPVVTLETPSGNSQPPVEILQVQEAPHGLILEYHFDSPLSTGTRITATIPAAISTQKVPFRINKVMPTEQSE